MTGTVSYDTRSALAAASVASGTNFVVTAGYSAVGDGGGATWARVSSAPSHQWKVQSADGAWWQVADDIVKPEQIGAYKNNSGFDLTLTLGYFEASPYGSLYLADGDWYTTNDWMDSAKHIIGPGSERMTYHISWRSIGEKRRNAIERYPRTRLIRAELFRAEGITANKCSNSALTPLP